MKTLFILAALLAGCAHVSAQRWCEAQCGDRRAECDVHSEHEVAIATCVCKAPIREQFEADLERALSRR